MPSNKLLFKIPSFTVNDINTDWIWPSPEKLFKLDFKYRHDRTDTTDEVTLDQLEEDWNNSVNTSQTEDWDVEEVLNSSCPLVTTYKYSRNGVENGTTGSSAQFEINIRCKNNIYSIATSSFPKHFDVLYLSNDSNAWNWGEIIYYGGITHITQHQYQMVSYQKFYYYIKYASWFKDSNINHAITRY